jgi:hypothetical protein
MIAVVGWYIPNGTTGSRLASQAANKYTCVAINIAVGSHHRIKH